jgi:diaminopimelate epimerase
VRFSKWHALGNSYLLVEERLDGETARRLCDVRYGIGSDGVLELHGDEVTIWNPDGSRAEFSGNGARIAAMWLSRRDGVDEVVVRSGGREYEARVVDGLVEMYLGSVEVDERESIEAMGERIELTPVRLGNPHAVVRGEYTRDDLLRLGPLLESHQRFPERTNVQLVRVDGRHELSVLVWERGAGETSASGSSAVAAAAAAVTGGWCESPVTVHMPGGDLSVEIDEDNRATLTGPAEEIASGELV